MFNNVTFGIESIKKMILGVRRGTIRILFHVKLNFISPSVSDSNTF